jgi:hypothetical protein
VNTTTRSALTATVLCLGLLACGKNDGAAAEAAAEKQAHEAAMADLKQPVALIAGYAPYAKYPDNPDKYFPARHPDYEKSTLCAANEIRYAANKARQKLETSSAKATVDLQAALGALTQACAEADDTDKLAKCGASIKALDAALAKTSAAAAALGVAGSYPRVAPESVTDEAKKAMATFLKARGPGDAEKAFVAKRSDSAVSPTDLSSSCEAAQAAAGDAADAYEKADEPIRLVAATRKMAMDSQCRRISEIINLSRDLGECKAKKKMKTPDCKTVCGKVKNWVDDGFPAAAFAPLEKDYTDQCKG